MQNCEIFYFDMDGTLVNNKNNTISKANIEALKKLKASGKKIATCTGRSVHDLETIIGLSEIDWDAYILSNGSVILDEKRQLIKALSFTPEWLYELIRLSPYPVMFEGDAIHVVGAITPRVETCWEFFAVGEFNPLRTYQGENVYNIILFTDDKLSDDLYNNLLKEAHIYRDQLNNYEIVPVIAGKHNSVRFVNEYYNFKRHCAFGDGDNDKHFLEEAPYSVAMDNAHQHIKDIASYITDSVDEDGVSKALVAHKMI